MHIISLMIKALENDFDAVHKLAEYWSAEGREDFAVSWLSFAAEKNDDVAMYLLGVKYTDENSPVYNLAKGNAILANSAYLGNNTARLYFARHIFKSAPEKLYERAVKMLLDALDDGVDEAKDELEKFFGGLIGEDDAPVWKSTVPFDLFKKAADMGIINAIEICSLVLFGNNEYVSFDEDYTDFELASDYVVKGAQNRTPISCLIYCQMVMSLLEQDSSDEDELLEIAEKCKLMREIKDTVLERFDFSGKYLEFYALYSFLLFKVHLCEKQKGNTTDAKLYATLAKAVYMTEPDVYDYDKNKGIAFTEAVIASSGMKMTDEEAKLFKRILDDSVNSESSILTDRHILCYVGYVVLVCESADDEMLSSARGFLSLYSKKDSEEYSMLENALNEKI